jgi:hypothetical protein
LLGAADASENPVVLIGKAVTIYNEARDLSGDDRTRRLREVDELLSRIEREHPDSVHAAFIADGRSIGSIDVAALRGTGARHPGGLSDQFEPAEEPDRGAHALVLRPTVKPRRVGDRESAYR